MFTLYLLHLSFVRRCFGRAGRLCTLSPSPRTFRRFLLGQAWLRLGHTLSLLAFRRRQAAREYASSLEIQLASRRRCRWFRFAFRAVDLFSVVVFGWRLAFRCEYTF